MAASAERALAEGLRLNYSAGAGVPTNVIAAQSQRWNSAWFSTIICQHGGAPVIAPSPEALEKMEPMLERIAVT